MTTTCARLIRSPMTRPTVLLLFASLFSGCAVASEGEVVITERFAPCPESPNCLNSTLPADHSHYTEPVFEGPGAAEAWARLHVALGETPRVALVASDDAWRHYTFTTRMRGYVDDVEIGLDGDRIDVRSASRLGWGDMGVNDRRVRWLRTAARGSNGGGD